MAVHLYNYCGFSIMLTMHGILYKSSFTYMVNSVKQYCRKILMGGGGAGGAGGSGFLKIFNKF